jgi:heptosyltransferase-1
VRSALICRLAHCGRVIGEARPRERAASLFFTKRVQTRGLHVIDQDIELASAVAGDNINFLPPSLPVHPAAEKWAEELVPRSGMRSVLINPGAGWGAKRWPVERYAGVAKALIDQGCRVLVNAGPGEEAFADAIAEQTAGAAIPLFSSLERLIAVTRRVDLVVAGDTGPLHLACALRKPVVGIYGPTDPARNGPYGTRFKVLRHPNSRRDHTRHEAPEAGLLTILHEDVMRAAEELLYPEAAS